jgi:hypothetical protein
VDFVTETWLHAAACGAGAALLLAAAAASAAHRPRLERGLCIALAALGVAAFLNFGDLHHQTDRGFVHRWEHFHYHLGSKYFPELGYDGLYVASLAAQHASHPEIPVGRRLRDLRTNRSIRAGDASEHRREVRGRFSPERWRRFVADHAAFAEAGGERFLTGVRRDHGYNPSPTWTFVARLLTAHAPVGPVSSLLLALLDPLLLGVAFAFVFRSFGLRAGCLALAILGLGFGWRYNYLGALLRLDWLAATLVGVCLLERGRAGLAGALVGYAAAVRLFPLLLALGPALLAVRAAWRGERPAWAVRFFGGLALALAAGLLAGALAGRGPGAWPEFAAKIRLHQQTWASTRVGLDSAVRNGPGVIAAGLAGTPPPRPSQAEAARASRERLPLRAALTAGLLLLFALAVRRATPAEACVLGIAAIWSLTPAGAYYWILLAVAPLARGWLASFGVLLLAAALYAHQALLPSVEWNAFRYALLSWGIGLVLIAWLASVALRGMPLAVAPGSRATEPEPS